jgi:SpoIID/LytB domain protein
VHRHSGSVVRVTTSGGTFATSRRVRWDETRYTTPSTSTLQAVQAISASSAGTAMDKYLAGLGEVPVTWPVEALKAQVVAARTYAARKLAVAGAVLYPTVKDQHYAGYPKEVEDAAYGSRWRSAVTATSGRVLVDSRGAMISAMYSSSSGGHTEDARYVFGSAGAAYLLDVDDSRWMAASSDGNRSWSAGFTRAQAAARLGFSSVESITVAPRGSDARWQDKVVVTGVRAGVRTTREIAGNTVRSAFGLKSPGFRIRLAVGGSGATPIAGDWDGDGRTDLGWFRNGAVALRWRDGSLRTFSFGQAGDIPVVGDWDGNGTDTIGVFRAGTWYLRNAHSTGAASYPAFRYGEAGDRPVAGDWAGVGRAGVGVKRGATWFLRRTATSGVGAVKFGYGATGDVPLLGDWDGNGTATVGVRRGATWYVRNTVATWTPSTGFGYGVAGDRPVVGDWDDDGDSGPGVVRGTTWHLRNAVSAGAAAASVAFAG